MIEPKNFFEYTPGILHLLTGSNSNNALIASMSEVSNGATHIRGYFEGIKRVSQLAIVKSIEGNFKSEIPYDVLVICTGTPYISPIRPNTSSLEKEARFSEINAYKNKLMGSEKICILGGGNI